MDLMDTSHTYCLHCHALAFEQDAACRQCQAPFVGNGSFHRVSGPRPSSLFTQLFAEARGGLDT